MNHHAGTGWQTALADLSLILFMVTAAALSQAPNIAAASEPARASEPAVLPALGEPVAVWREEPGAPPLRQWLAEAGSDPQLQLTILAPASAAEAALALARQAGRPARIVLESASTGSVAATLTYDRVPPLAQGLH